MYEIKMFSGKIIMLSESGFKNFIEAVKTDSKYVFNEDMVINIERVEYIIKKS